MINTGIGINLKLDDIQTIIGYASGANIFDLKKQNNWSGKCSTFLPHLLSTMSSYIPYLCTHYQCITLWNRPKKPLDPADVEQRGRGGGNFL